VSQLTHDDDCEKVMYPASYIYWSEIDHHRLVFSFVMDELVDNNSKGK